MRISVALTALSFLGVAQQSFAGEDYYLLMFASQRIPNNSNFSHTFASFVRATWAGNGPCPKDAKLEVHTISWLPANGIVRTWACCPECGDNFELHRTMRWALDGEQRVSLWGPFRIDPELYGLAIKQVGVLSSGQVRYKTVDTGYPSDRVTNCVHALSSIVEGYRLPIIISGWGEVASFAILERYDRYIINPCLLHPWVGTALGLDQFPIIYRDWECPNRGLFGPVYRLFGGERNICATYGSPR